MSFNYVLDSNNRYTATEYYDANNTALAALPTSFVQCLDSELCVDPLKFLRYSKSKRRADKAFEKLVNAKKSRRQSCRFHPESSSWWNTYIILNDGDRVTMLIQSILGVNYFD